MSGALRLTVEVEALASDARDTEGSHLQVTGTVRREDGAEHPFVGWIGLMAVLHDAVVLAASQAG